MKILVVLVSVLAFLLVALAGPLYKFDIVELGTSFSSFKYGVILAVIALILLIIQVIFKRKTVSMLSAITVVTFSAISIIVPLSMMNKAKNVPPIHDISTDTVTPPEFVAIAPLRADAPNPVAYSGIETAEQQRNAYPDLQTLRYTQSKAELVVAVKKTIDDLGWEVINTDANAGLVEATDSTMWFGFKDDLVVRITDNGSERLLDVRSKSRVGGSDLGKNAERIRDFTEALDEVLGE